MESQCSQNQNRFKRRGQFWSKGGFASFLEAYVWYTARATFQCNIWRSSVSVLVNYADAPFRPGSARFFCGGGGVLV